MNKKQFIAQCQKALENFNNGNERLADKQVQILEVTLEKKFKKDQDCFNEMKKVWEAEHFYHEKNRNR